MGDFSQQWFPLKIPLETHVFPQKPSSNSCNHGFKGGFLDMAVVKHRVSLKAQPFVGYKFLLARCFKRSTRELPDLGAALCPLFGGGFKQIQGPWFDNSGLVKDFTGPCTDSGYFKLACTSRDWVPGFPGPEGNRREVPHVQDENSPPRERPPPTPAGWLEVLVSCQNCGAVTYAARAYVAEQCSEARVRRWKHCKGVK